MAMRLLRGGYQEVVDGDLSNYFGSHAELMKSIARRVSDGRMQSNGWRFPGRRERKGKPRSHPCSAIFMRRFVLGKSSITRMTSVYSAPHGGQASWRF